jgi:hypothetical protein
MNKIFLISLIAIVATLVLGVAFDKGCRVGKVNKGKKLTQSREDAWDKWKHARTPAEKKVAEKTLAEVEEKIKDHFGTEGVGGAIRSTKDALKRGARYTEQKAREGVQLGKDEVGRRTNLRPPGFEDVFRENEDRAQGVKRSRTAPNPDDYLVFHPPKNRGLGNRSEVDKTKIATISPDGEVEVRNIAPKLKTIPIDGWVLNFGRVYLGESVSQVLTLENIGDKHTTLDAYVENPSNPFNRPEWGQANIQSGEQETRMITFSPTEIGEFETSLKVTTNGGFGEAKIKLVGEGVEKPQPPPPTPFRRTGKGRILFAVLALLFVGGGIANLHFNKTKSAVPMLIIAMMVAIVCIITAVGGL